MSIQATKLLSTDSERQLKLQELAAEQDPDWTMEYQPGSFGCHELLDRTLLAGDTVEQFVLTHPACVLNPEWYALAHQAVTALRELYQRIGAEHLDHCPE